MSQLDVQQVREVMLQVKTADLYDVLDAMGYPDQCLDLEIRPLRDDMRVAGPAFTILGTREPLYGPELPIPEFDDFAVFDRFYKGCVVVINAEGERLAGHWGEMMSYGARNAGATGVVIDGGTRDKMGILAIPNWACFARYTSPIESERRWRPKKAQVPIFMSGTTSRYVRVNPGDWVVGDADGVMIIPQEILPEVIQRVKDLGERERLAVEALARGESLKAVFERYHRA